MYVGATFVSFLRKHISFPHFFSMSGGASSAVASTTTVARPGVAAKKSPSEYLKSLVGRPVTVRLTSGVDYRGASSRGCSTRGGAADEGRREKSGVAAGVEAGGEAVARGGGNLLSACAMRVSRYAEYLQACAGGPRPPSFPRAAPLAFAGILICLDGFMNVALEQTEEWSSGVLSAKHGDAFLRGNNVLYITAPRTAKGR